MHEESEVHVGLSSMTSSRDSVSDGRVTPPTVSVPKGAESLQRKLERKIEAAKQQASEKSRVGPPLISYDRVSSSDEIDFAPLTRPKQGSKSAMSKALLTDTFSVENLHLSDELDDDLDLILPQASTSQCCGDLSPDSPVFRFTSRHRRTRAHLKLTKKSEATHGKDASMKDDQPFHPPSGFQPPYGTRQHRLVHFGRLLTSGDGAGSGRSRVSKREESIHRYWREEDRIRL
ncbi:unnamed protein product [Darwinula stevensoni]|uniref:Uncharacterized protein n=1 Tax=Darwinula stevensoni TaxID=69355 RepID=A0A7R8X498_9CRUS|nr:unnamed protein product [Darwinula stevensoni]CAG0885794.1 unnamed protein product [Darwinula stevensoni]